MEILYSIVSLLAGLGTFLIGFKIISENIETLANNSLKKLFNKTSKNKLVGVGIGATSTALVQSSAATTIMVVGFVNAGVMSLYQAATIIMGANIGTTITAQIVALQSFKVVDIIIIFAFIGVFMNIISKKDKIKALGLAIAGFGLVFIGLSLMTNSLSEYADSEFVTDIISSVTNPLLLLLIGIVITALVQSSSAITSIVISMAAAGIVVGGAGNGVLFIIIGSNIGSCITALLSSIGANTNARRASIIHLLFNCFGAIIFMIFLLIYKDFMPNVLARMFALPETQIAMFHTFFNLVCTFLFLPFTKLFVKLSTILVHDKNKSNDKDVFIDERFLLTPSIAVDQAKKEVLYLGDLSMKALKLSLEDFYNIDSSKAKEIKELNEYVDKRNNDVVSYLVKVSNGKLAYEDEEMVSFLHHTLTDFLRISEIADNIIKYTKHTIEAELTFSDFVKVELEDLHSDIESMFESVKESFTNRSPSLLKLIDNKENTIDSKRKNLIDSHIQRLNEGKCKPESSTIFINLVNNLERIGDHLTYVAHRTF